jgi:very-short-patch-repair endonuclease
MSIRGTTSEIERQAKQLRHEMTQAEARLWQALKSKQLDGLRFRSQHPVGRFILDFYCSAHKLVVEVDGGIHEEQVERDSERATVLAAYGYRVIRFSNEEIGTNLPTVLERIRNAAQTTDQETGS